MPQSSHQANRREETLTSGVDHVHNNTDQAKGNRFLASTSKFARPRLRRERNAAHFCLPPGKDEPTMLSKKVALRLIVQPKPSQFELPPAHPCPLLWAEPPGPARSLKRRHRRRTKIQTELASLKNSIALPLPPAPPQHYVTVHPEPLGTLREVKPPTARGPSRLAWATVGHQRVHSGLLLLSPMHRNYLLAACKQRKRVLR